MQNLVNTGEPPLPLETLMAKHPHPRQGGFLSGEGFTQNSSLLTPQCRAFAIRLGCVQFSVLLGRSGLYPGLPLGEPW